MAAQWKGKSRGSVLGYKIFVFLIKKVGLRSAYFLLYFVAAYFCFFARDSTKALRYYLHKRRHFSKAKSLLKVYQSYYVFGQTIVDKIAISSGLRNKFTYHFDGIDQLKKLLQQKAGGILISAHIGNFEIAQYFLNELDEDVNICLLTTDTEHSAIKNYLDSVTHKTNVKSIVIKQDFSHIFEINAALAKNEIICVTGDRYVEGSKCLTAPLMGKNAVFPAGPFLLGAKLKVPVLFVSVMKETNTHYHLFARVADAHHNDAKELLQEYTQNLEWMLETYPLQWFNYFNFWDDLS